MTPHTTTTDAAHALDCIRCRAHLLGNDSLDLAVWCRATGNSELIAAAAQFARAKDTLYRVSNAALVNGADETPTEARTE